MDINKCLDKIGALRVIGHDKGMIIRKAIKDGTADVTSFVWNDDWRNKNPDLYSVDLTTIDMWSTYQNCVELRITRQLCSIILYDGRGFDGSRGFKRWEASVTINSATLKKFSSYIHSEMTHKSKCAYKKMLEEKELEWRVNYLAEYGIEL